MIKEDSLDMFSGTEFQYVAPFHTQLLKWIGNKQRFAHEIAAYFPTDVKTYFEPFLGSGAVWTASWMKSLPARNEGSVSHSASTERRSRTGSTVVWICPTGCLNEKCP